MVDDPMIKIKNSLCHSSMKNQHLMRCSLCEHCRYLFFFNMIHKLINMIQSRGIKFDGN